MANCKVYQLVLFMVFMFPMLEVAEPNKTNAFPYRSPPAFFVFGDSLCDTGNYIEAFPFTVGSENSPYGTTFFHSQTGRASDGRLIIDFIASKWGLPFLEHSFKNVVPNFKYGINFAVGGATAHNSTKEPGPFPLPLQTDHFVRFKRNVFASMNSTTRSADPIASQVPEIEAFNNGTYIIFIGVNDILRGILFHHLTPPVLTAKIVPLAVKAISKAVLDLHKEGAKNFLVVNILAIGCTPILLTLESQGPYNLTDNFGCLKEYNEVADFVNKELEKSLSDVKKLLEDTNIMVVDLHRFHLDAIENPTNYGFNESEKFKACCGYEGTPFNFNLLMTCGQNSAIKACSKPGEHICWDGLHFTDAFNQIFVEEVMEKMHYLKPVIA